jgi:hypothetical protein
MRGVRLLSVLVAIALNGCSSSVGPIGDGGADVPPPPSDVTAVDVPTSDVVPDTGGPSPSCADLRATCNTPPQFFVHAHASGLTGLDGAFAQFGVRYLLVNGMGLDAPRATVAARGTVQGGAFELCVCVPMNSDAYPIVASVVFAAGSPGLAGRDAVRAFSSQQFAVTPDDDVSMSLVPPPSPLAADVALADTVVRTVTLTAHGFDAMSAGNTVYAGLVASERPVATQLAQASVSGGSAMLRWDAPGLAWGDESLAILVDRNGDHACGTGDEGAIVSYSGGADVTVTSWLSGSALTPVCDALLVGTTR